MYCDENKVKEIITQMTRLYNDLLEVNATLEEKKQYLSDLTIGHIDTNINEINPKIEESLDRFRTLIAEIETKATSIMALNNLKGDALNKNLSALSATSTATITPTTSRFTMEVSKQEALNAIAKNLNNNREITKLVNAEIAKEKAVLR